MYSVKLENVMLMDSVFIVKNEYIKLFSSSPYAMLVTCVHPALSLMGLLQLNPQLLTISSDARICVLGDAPPLPRPREMPSQIFGSASSITPFLFLSRTTAPLILDVGGKWSRRSSRVHLKSTEPWRYSTTFCGQLFSVVAIWCNS